MVSKVNSWVSFSSIIMWKCYKRSYDIISGCFIAWVSRSIGRSSSEWVTLALSVSQSVVQLVGRSVIQWVSHTISQSVSQSVSQSSSWSFVRQLVVSRLDSLLVSQSIPKIIMCFSSNTCLTVPLTTYHNLHNYVFQSLQEVFPQPQPA